MLSRVKVFMKLTIAMAISIVLVGAVCVTRVDAVSVTLVKKGSPKSVIILAKKPTRSAQLAAKELQEHIRGISGADLQIIKENEKIPQGMLPIYVGESEATREVGLISVHFAVQESLIRIADKYLVFIGHDDQDFGPISYERNGAWPGFPHLGQKPFFRLGTLYAVYDFLERVCGVRWYMVTDLGRVMPKEKTLDFELTEKRFKCWTTYRDTTRNHWQIPGEIPEQGKKMTLASIRDNNLFLFRTRIGGEPRWVTHSVMDYGTRFGKEHPDWFVGKPGPSIQLHYDNPEVIEQVAKDAMVYFSKTFAKRRFGVMSNPDCNAEYWSAGDFFAVAPGDNRDYGDKTNPPLQPERRGKGFGTGVASNYIFTWVNNVARKVHKEYPDKWIYTIAYADMFEPPDFEMESNVAVAVCMADGWDDSQGMKVLKAWRKKVSRLSTWEYCLDDTISFPRVRPRQIAKYISQLEDMNIDGMFIEPPAFHGQGGYRNPGLYHLNHYITFLMLRERDVDIESVLKEYYELFYGPAARHMEKFWNILESLHKDKEINAAGTFAKWASPVLENRLNNMRSLMEKSQQVADREPYAERLKIIKKTVFGMLEQRQTKYAQIADSPVSELKVIKTDLKPVLDGKTDEDIWSRASTTQPFRHINDTPVAIRTVGKVIMDNENLYIAFECEEPFMEKLVLNQLKPSPSVCVDDSIEIMIGGGHDFRKEGYLHVMMNVNGLIWYRWPGITGQMEDLPDLEIRGAGWKGKDKWTVEIIIPLKNLADTPPDAGEKWGLGLYRNRPMFGGLFTALEDNGRWTCWSPTFGGFNTPARFGIMRFGE